MEEEEEGAPGLLSLPDEVLGYVGRFLPLKDLLALTACCCRLRSALNDNALWRRLYRRPIVRYINSAPGFVEPLFDAEVRPTCDSLEPVCAERVNLLRQNHMLENWRSGRCVDHEAVTPGDGLFLENNDRQIIYGNVYLFLHTLNTNQIDVWNIEETPYLYTSVFFTLYEYDDDDDEFGDAVRVWYQIVGDKLVVIQGNLVQVFAISLPDRELPLDRLIATDKDGVSTGFYETLFSDCYSWIVGHLLFSRLCFCSEVHVWDLVSGAKLRTLHAPTTGWDLYVISLDDADNIIFTLRTDDPYDAPDDYSKITNHISNYNVSRDEFTTLFPNMAGCKPVHAMQYGDFIVLFCIDDMFIFRCSIYVFERRTSNVIARATFNDLVGLYKSRIIQDRLILATQRSVEILDAKSLEVVRSVKIEDTVDIDYLPVFDTTFIITSSLNKDTEVRDIDKNQVLLKIPLNSCVFLNESCSKLTMITGQHLVVKNFW